MQLCIQDGPNVGHSPSFPQVLNSLHISSSLLPFPPDCFHLVLSLFFLAAFPLPRLPDFLYSSYLLAFLPLPLLHFTRLPRARTHPASLSQLNQRFSFFPPIIKSTTSIHDGLKVIILSCVCVSVIL